MPEIQFESQKIEYRSQGTDIVLDTTGVSLKIEKISQSENINIWV